ncbi:outer membrane protein assembly factor BamD [Alkalilimnicola ehrlichii MLHE-1]|uniref:Outer membrane protein assembly factor BamD n=1 Tax=Alkalilimnicola ehrlichii (strain ATCC BAA-1101 / DSM 17681 / MLHE-1) TaxID=187272 RepID=Q0A5J6_ALKEH|nr:outer membrane protein assembly factor BamD [Alkalilimnicola ehrlichii]ABI57891.1 putative lipoprotein [Alkalilimnicola ehrlichii MLHE-1]
MSRKPWLWSLLLIVPLLLAGGCSSNGPERQEEQATAEELYQQARRQLENGNYTMAVETLERLQGRFPFGPFATQAQLDIIYAYYQAGELESTIAAADRFMRLYPRDPNVAYARYMRGLANAGVGDEFFTRVFNLDRSLRDPQPLRRAFVDFRELIQRHPDSEYVDDARERMQEIRDLLARHEIYVARFYLRRDAPVAAVGRARTVLQEYQGTGAVEDALEVLVEAYGMLELADLQQDVRRVIGENFPGHPLAAQ